MNVYPFIAAERARQSNVPWACALPTVSRAAYYAWSAGTPSARRLADEELLEQICMAHKASRGTYGSPRITGELRSRGVRVGRKRVARLMAHCFGCFAGTFRPSARQMRCTCLAFTDQPATCERPVVRLQA